MIPRRSPAARSLAGRVNAASERALSSTEERRIARIEQLRGDINASEVPLVRTDHGAGDPDSIRTQSEMMSGVEVTDSLGRFSTTASAPPDRCLMLFNLVRSVRPLSCIELGTAVGISAAYQAAALELNGQGSLVTLEGAASLAEVARSTFRRLELDNVQVVVGRFADTLPEVLAKHRPVDYVFVDGHHVEQATLEYFDLIVPCLAEAALLVFDDIAWSEGMGRAWHAIARDRRVDTAMELGSVGLCIVDATR